jgi:hypothetical protein
MISATTVVNECSKRLSSTQDLLAALRALFEAGEEQSLSRNRAVFAQLFEQEGSSGTLLLSTISAPHAPDSAFLEGFESLRAARRALVLEPRGLAPCAELLRTSAAKQLLRQASTASSWAELLEWHATCRVPPEEWGALASILRAADWQSLTPRELALFLRGMWLADPGSYEDWLESSGEVLRPWLCARLDCIDVRWSDAEVDVRFFVDPKGPSPNEQAVTERLNFLRGIFPHVGMYRSRGEFLLPFNLRPSVDASQKAIPAANLAFFSDVERNKVWIRHVATAFLPDGYYRLQEAWVRCRQLINRFLRDLTTVFEARMRTQPVTVPFEYVDELGRTLKLVPRLLDFAKYGPGPPTGLEGPAKGADAWVADHFAAARQVLAYAEEFDVGKGKLALESMRRAKKGLSQVHEAFSLVCGTLSPDYFGMLGLAEEEVTVHARAFDAFDGWLAGVRLSATDSISRAVARRRDDRAISGMDALRRNLREICPEAKARCAARLVVEDNFRYAGVCVELAREEELLEALLYGLKLASVSEDETDFFCVLPLFQGMRVAEGCYQFSIGRAQELLDSSEPSQFWESFVLLRIPAGVAAEFASIPIRTPPALKAQGALGVIGMLETLIRASELASTFRSAENAWEREAHERQMATVMRYVDSIRAVIDELIMGPQDEWVEKLMKIREALGTPLEFDGSLIDEAQKSELARLARQRFAN